MGNGTHVQWGILVNTADRGHLGVLGTPVMGHMSNGVYWLILQIKMKHLGGWGTLEDGQWSTWAIGHMDISSLILQGSSPKFYSTYIWIYSFRIHSNFSTMAFIY